MSRVRGPNSALTEFLRSQGINATDIRNRYERQQSAEAALEVPEPEQAASEEQDPQIRAIAEAAAAKRRADLDAEQLATEGTDLCAACGTRFVLTVYTQSDGSGNLCRNCGNKTKAARGRKAGVGAGKKRKVMAKALLNLTNETSPSLQDLCISTVADYIDEVDELGDLTTQNFEKIANILTKNRRLSNRTVQLFLRHTVTTLELADCSQLTPEAYYTIAAACPNLERLSLDMCGQLDNEGVSRFAALPNLKSVFLDGPFQVRAEAWIDFFETCGERLEEFGIRSVYRFTPEVMAVMTDHGQRLRTLKLERLVQMADEAPIYLLSGLTSLQHLELKCLEPGVVNDESLAAALGEIGLGLRTLVIQEGSLSDAIIDSIASCSALEHLELSCLPEISNDAVAMMFFAWTQQETNKGMHTLSFERSIGIGNEAVQAAVTHCHASLVDLNLNSLKTVTPAVFETIAKLPNIAKLDLGFIGNIEPHHVYRFSTTALKQLLVFGNIRLSRMPLPENLTVVGTM